MEQLVQETIKKIYNTFIEYQDKVDVFYVAFSGGKDSVVPWIWFKEHFLITALRCYLGILEWNSPIHMRLLKK